jgi:hypothetical protein
MTPLMHLVNGYNTLVSDARILSINMTVTISTNPTGAFLNKSFAKIIS